MTIQIDNSRDANLTDFSKAILKDRYLLKEIKDKEGNISQKDETFQEFFKRVAFHTKRSWNWWLECK